VSSLPLRQTDAPPSLFVDDVFDAVVSLPATEREDELRRRCHGHPTVEQEVRQLLDAVLTTEADDDPLPEALEPGVRLGRYRLEEELGAGATASVWKAFDEQLRSWTALKLLHPHVHGPTAIDVVMTEARAASRIISDHVVRIKSAGSIGELHYIDMALCAEHRPDEDGIEDLVIGRTLADTPLDSIDEICRVMAEAAEGVDAAHRVGILHRDLKPANILVLPVSRRALVTDFGLAAPGVAPEARPDSDPTETVTIAVGNGDGRLVGTPCFMPPEQAFGDRLRRTSDVYALGATLYALVSGQAPYQPRDLPIRPALETVLRVREEAPVDVREVEPRVPERLARIVRKAMARDAGDRYPTAAHLAQDLRLYRAGRPTSVDRRRPFLQTWLFVQRHRSAVITGAILTSLLVAMLLGAAWMAYERRELLAAVEMAETGRAQAAAQADAAMELEAKAQSQRAAALEASREAQAAAERAHQARQKALQSESDAERRWAEERAAREAAEAAQAAAEAARLEAEAATAEALEAQEASRLAAEAETQRRAGVEAALEATQQERDHALRQRDDELAARSSAEAELRQLHVELVELEAQRDAAREAHAAAELRAKQASAEHVRLQEALSLAEAECSQPQPADAELGPPPLATVEAPSAP